MQAAIFLLIGELGHVAIFVHDVVDQCRRRPPVKIRVFHHDFRHAPKGAPRLVDRLVGQLDRRGVTVLGTLFQGLVERGYGALVSRDSRLCLGFRQHLFSDLKDLLGKREKLVDMCPTGVAKGKILVHNLFILMVMLRV